MIKPGPSMDPWCTPHVRRFDNTIVHPVSVSEMRFKAFIGAFHPLIKTLMRQSSTLSIYYTVWTTYTIVVFTFSIHFLFSAQDESGATAEERQNDQNAGLEGEESRPDSRPLLQETQAGMTKASPPLEDEDRGLGDSLPNTTSSSQTSLSALPTAVSNTPHQSPATFRQLPADLVRSRVRMSSNGSHCILKFSSRLKLSVLSRVAGWSSAMSTGATTR